MMRISAICQDALTEEVLGAFAETRDLEWSSETRPGRSHRLVHIFCGQDVDAQTIKHELQIFLSQILSAESMPRLTIRPVRTDWDTAWKRFFRGRVVAGRFWIGPPWEAIASVPLGCIQLVIDAGTAFGTGHHPTTELVLALTREMDFRKASVLDAGTGSGVLAIAACKLGATHVTAYDIDQNALELAKNNAQANGVGPKITYYACTVQNLPENGPWDIILANMLPSQFSALADEAHRLLAPTGRIIFSGILSAVWPETRDLLEECGLVIESVVDDDAPAGGWTACLARKS
jgi:ribosomal protein L11 methyltransferase